MSPKLIRWITLSISIVLFGASLSQPCYSTDRDWMIGIGAFAFGIFGWMMVCQAWLSWIANPLMIWAWIVMKKRPVRAFYLSLVGTMLAAAFINCHKIFANEGGSTAEITKLGIGYWLWLSSVAITLIGSTILMLAAKKQQTKV